LSTRTIKRLLCTTGLALPLAVGLGAADVQAQQQQRQERQEDNPFQPLGIRAGAFLVHPQLAVSGTYDDNIFADDENEEDDFFLDVQPSVTAESQWSRHELNVTAGADTSFYVDNTDNNYFDYGIDAEGRLDVLRGSRLNARLSLGRDHELRTSQDDAGQDEITQIYRGVADLNYRHNFNRVFVQPGVIFRRNDFTDTDDINNDDRDNLRSIYRLRAGYAVSPRFNVFGQGDYVVVDYDETPNDQGIDRNSDGYAIGGGVEVELTNILVGEVGIGYREQSYDDDALSDFSGIGANAALTWYLTRLTTIVASVDADVEETTVSFEGEPASSVYAINAGVEATHELRRNILLSGNLNYLRDDFEGTSRVDDTFVAGAGLRYLLNRNLGVDATYGFATRSSDADNGDFTRNIFRIGVVARL